VKKYGWIVAGLLFGFIVNGKDGFASISNEGGVLEVETK
jgi:hypothetical protein